MITQINDNVYKNMINNIKKQRGYEKRKSIAAFKMDIKVSISKLARMLEVSRKYIRKCLEEFSLNKELRPDIETRGRKSIDKKYSSLAEDIKNVIEDFSQIDPSFKTEKMYVRLTVNQITNMLVNTGKYTIASLPKKSAMSKYLNKLGYKLAKVKKTKPLKKIQETDIIFENVNHVKEIYRNDDDTVMISIDAKDRVKIGGFSRKGLSRIEVNALDHDFNSEYVTPFGILDMKTNEVNLYNTKSKVTADYIIDVIIDFWKEKEYDKSKKKLVIFSDNGPENSSRRSRFIYRLVLMADTYNIEIEMVYYPPYHSKYNAIERVWARLENMWNGSLIDTIDTCINYMRNLTWNKVKSNVKLILKEYQIGIKENKQTLLNIEKYITRKKGIEKWAFSISN